MIKRKTFNKLVLMSAITLCLLVLLNIQLIGAQETSSVQSDANDFLVDHLIPTGFDTYTLFLFCGHEWSRKERNKEAQDLFRDFLNFADSIGDKNMAIWFWEDMKNSKIDIKRCQNYCDAFDLDPNGSPYILITSFYPITDLVYLPTL